MKLIDRIEVLKAREVNGEHRQEVPIPISMEPTGEQKRKHCSVSQVMPSPIGTPPPVNVLKGYLRIGEVWRRMIPTHKYTFKN